MTAASILGFGGLAAPVPISQPYSVVARSPENRSPELPPILILRDSMNENSHANLAVMRPKRDA